jgi:23S rRNA (uracil1939-C5)-methyltransferase
VTPTLACVHADTCGGCPLIRLGYEEQLAQKEQRVRQSVQRYPALAAVSVEAVRGANPRSGYRTRAKLMVAPGGRLGLFAAAGAHAVVDTPECIVLAPVLARVAGFLRAMIARDEVENGPLAPRGGGSGDGGLVAVDLREVVSHEGGSAGALVTLVVVRGARVRLERLREAASALSRAVPEVRGVAVNFHDGESPQVLGAETLGLAGQSSADDAIGGVLHRATFGSFVQAHRGQAARVHAEIAAAVFADAASAPRVLDLYGGSGAIALGLAARGAEVHMIESFAPAVQQALESAKAAGHRLVAERADVADGLRALAERGSRYDAAVVNPPRRGLDPQVRARLAKLQLRVIVYVSCHPETLARDVDHLARLGFATRLLVPFDMIPLTEEVETVAVLRRAASPSPVVLFEDDEIVIVDKPPFEPTTPQGEHDGSLLKRVRRLAPGAVAVQRLDVGTSGVIVFAKHAAPAGAWSTALRDSGEKTYVTAVRGRAPEAGVVDRPLVVEGKRRDAHTTFARTAELGAHSVLRVTPREGRTHQIRRHLASIGHPVLGDARYGHAPTNRFFAERHGLDRTFLHSARLEVVHPSSGRRITVEAPLPGDLEAALTSASREPR